MISPSDFCTGRRSEAIQLSRQRASNVVGIVMPSPLAVRKLSLSRNSVTWSTGILDGRAPARNRGVGQCGWAVGSAGTILATKKADALGATD